MPHYFTGSTLFFPAFVYKCFKLQLYSHTDCSLQRLKINNKGLKRWKKLKTLKTCFYRKKIKKTFYKRLLQLAYVSDNKMVQVVDPAGVHWSNSFAFKQSALLRARIRWRGRRHSIGNRYFHAISSQKTTCPLVILTLLLFRSSLFVSSVLYSVRLINQITTLPTAVTLPATAQKLGFMLN